MKESYERKMLNLVLRDPGNFWISVFFFFLCGLPATTSLDFLWFIWNYR